jgi:MFS family permease
LRETIAAPRANVPQSAAETPAPSPDGASGTHRNLQRMFRPLYHRNYRLLFFGQLTSLIGTWMQTVAQGWLVLKLTNSSMALGEVNFANNIPIVLIALFAGVVIDQVDRRRMLIATQVVMMLTAFILAALTWGHVVRVEHIIILTAINGMVGAFDRPGRQSFVIDMVGGREDLPAAIALNSMIFNGARVMGPALAGIALMFISEAGCFFVNGLSFLAVIWSLCLMEMPARVVRTSELGMLRRVQEGLVYAWRHSAIFSLLIAASVNSGLATTYTVLIPIFAAHILHGNARTYGLLMACTGVGALIGALILSSHNATTGQIRQHQVGGLICMGAGVIVFGISRLKPLSFAAQFLVGLGMMNFNASNNTLLQLFVDDELRGRVMSLYTLAMMGLTPLGSLEIGFVGEHVSPRAAVVGAGCVSLLCCAYIVSRVKALSRPTAIAA